MRISVEVRAGAAEREGAHARVLIEEPVAAASIDGARGRIVSIVVTIVGIAGAVTSLPELSERLSPRVVMALHFIAMVGTSAQPLIVALATAVIAAIAERRQNHEASDPPDLPSLHGPSADEAHLRHAGMLPHGKP